MCFNWLFLVWWPHCTENGFLVSLKNLRSMEQPNLVQGFQDITEAEGLDSSLVDGTTESLENLMRACWPFPGNCTDAEKCKMPQAPLGLLDTLDPRCAGLMDPWLRSFSRSWERSRSISQSRPLLWLCFLLNIKLPTVVCLPEVENYNLNWDCSYFCFRQVFMSFLSDY